MLKTSLSVRAHKGIQLAEGETAAVGIDVHKKSFAVCLWSVQEDRLVKHWTQPSHSHVLMRKLEPVRHRIEQIAYEAGPSGFVLARALLEDNWPVLVTPPANVPTARNDPKSDRRDARKLARLASKKMLASCHIPTGAQEQERQLVRIRDRILADKNRVRLRIKSLLLCHGLSEPAGLRHWSKAGIAQLRKLQCSADLRMCLNVYLRELADTTRLLQTCDRQLVKLAQRHHNRAEIECLCTIGGIAEPSALHFIVEMGPRGRFYDRIEVCRYQGLAPEVRSSGESRAELNLGRSGNRKLRTMLIEAAWRWIRYDQYARSLYCRMLQNTGDANKAIVAVARKLGIIMWRMRESLTPYKNRQQDQQVQ